RIPLNDYAIIALLMVLCVAFFGIDIGPMRRHEQRAVRGEGLGAVEGEADRVEEESAPDGRIRDLVLPIGVLVVVTVAGMIVTGALASGSLNLLEVFENTDVPTSLLIGSVLGWCVALLFARRRSVSRVTLRRSMSTGVRSMLPAMW